MNNLFRLNLKSIKETFNLSGTLFLVLFFLGCFIARSEYFIAVTDSITGEGLPLATIQFSSPESRTLITDSEGKIKIKKKPLSKSVRISYAGYKEKEIKSPLPEDTLKIKLVPESIELAEIIVKPGKTKYSKRNNPAVDFMQIVRKNAERHNPVKNPYYSYDKYEKTLIAVNNFNSDFNTGILGNKMKFLENYVDTSAWTGARLLDLVLKERFSTRLTSNDGKIDKEIIHSYRSEGIDDALNGENMRVILDDVVREIDIYDNDINILQNRFVSPLSPIGPDFYKYFLKDTVYIGNEKCIELNFAPRNDRSMGFIGYLYVSIDDTTNYVKKVTMHTPQHINLNFLKNLFISQSFELDSLGNHNKLYDDICIEMQIMKGTPELYGRKTTVYDNFSYDKREDLAEFYNKLGDSFTLTDKTGETAEFWNEKRMVPLTPAESRLGGFTANMRKIPVLYWAEKFISLMESGYLTTGKPSKFDIGPLNTLISYNSVEGVRLRLGGMTMAALNPHLFVKGFAAYGFRDHRWKYFGQIEYSFLRKPHHAYEWPRHGFYASFGYDLDNIGQHYLFTNPDNVFLSWKRMTSDLVTYRYQGKAGYVLELPNNFSVEAGFSWEKQEATRCLPFEFGTHNFINSYCKSAFNITLRWAKGEKFVQGRSTRLPVNMDAWIFQLSQEWGPKGLWNSAFTMNRTEFSMQKRFWFSAFGYLDMIVKAGKLWSSVYYPELLWQNANLSYTIQPESFSLLSPMEFANDCYASVDINYFGNGILFNRIPYIKKLKLREAITFKGFKGWLSDKNNPKYNQNLLMFPADCLALKMGNIPYMEIGAGIDNIFSVLRVDYVWRLSYRNNPGVDRSGVRVSLHFTL